jgi:hypothetical protein
MNVSEARSTTLLAALPKVQADRLAYIEFRLFFLGELRRQDVMDRFQTGPAGATRDIAMYKQLAPENLDFDSTAKVYRPASAFHPVFAHEPVRVLTALSQGFGEVATDRQGPLVACEVPAQPGAPQIELLAAVSRAIHRRKPLRVTYFSNTSGRSDREVVPLALVNTGARWHVRAYDRKSQEFRDFVLTRFAKATLVEDGEVHGNETADKDVQWSRIIELELVPHPSVQRPEVVKMDYDMPGGVLKVRARAANIGYMLRLWSVDCSPDHSLVGPEYTLWLRDPLVLYGADSAHLAPGYKAPAARKH